MIGGHVYIEMLEGKSGKLYAFPALLNDDRWNGWAMPGFTKEVADVLVPLYNEAHAKEYPHCPPARYDAERDEYVFPSPESDDPERDAERFPKRQGRYWIGAACWVWSAVGDHGEHLADFILVPA